MVLLNKIIPMIRPLRRDTTFRTISSSRTNGILPPEPHRTPFGLIRIFLVVVPGLLIGAAISKNIANFLEENDLFVPSDDDDDDD